MSFSFGRVLAEGEEPFNTILPLGAVVDDLSLVEDLC
jgi:hypothetical protein